MVLWNVVLIIRRDNINNSVCVCLSGSPSGSWPTLQVHHPRIAGPHQGGVSVSPGTVPQVDNTQTRTHDIHKEESPDVLDSPVSSSVCVICPPTLKPHPNHNCHNEQKYPALASD